MLMRQAVEAPAPRDKKLPAARTTRKQQWDYLLLTGLCMASGKCVRTLMEDVKFLQVAIRQEASAQ